MNINFEKVKLKTLTWCIEDWTDLHAIYCFVREFFDFKDLALVKQMTLDVIQNLLENELVIAGIILPGNHFKPYKMSIDVLVAKIKFDWDNLGRKLAPEEIIWFDITEKGRKEFEYLNSLPELKETNPFYLDDK